MDKSFNSADLPQWQKDIINKYPEIYISPNPRLKDYFSESKYIKLINNKNFCNLRYGFECDKGWAGLIDEFSATCQEILTEIRFFRRGNTKFYIKSFILKEKFGQLTWQGDHNLPEPFNKLFNTYINSIETKSFYICELTGKQGDLCIDKNHIMKTLSIEKKKELGYDVYTEN